jgi:hypothetical protein
MGPRRPRSHRDVGRQGQIRAAVEIATKRIHGGARLSPQRVLGRGAVGVGTSRRPRRVCHSYQLFRLHLSHRP